MAVKRIVVNIGVSDTASAEAFYGGIFGMSVAMDLGWIVTFASDASTVPQISVATGGGSGAPVPDLSIEVDNLDETQQRLVAGGFAIHYGPTREPWGVRRLFVRDPFGRLLNVLSHD